MANKKVLIPVLAAFFAAASAFAPAKQSTAKLVVNYEQTPKDCAETACGANGNTLCSNTFSDIGCTQSITLRRLP
jgi:hypothetical protein